MTDSERTFLAENGWIESKGGYFYDSESKNTVFGTTALSIQSKRTQTNTVSSTVRISGSVTTSISVVAQDVLHSYDPVTITGKLADSGNSAFFGKVLGLIANDLGVGFSGNVIVDGLVTNPAWSWTAGSPIYLNGSSLSQTAPSTGFVQQIGIAKASDTIYVDLSVPIQL
jgi:predicted RecA/RadA family phage recombinase